MTVGKRKSSTDDKVEAKRKIIRQSLDEITAEVASKMRGENRLRSYRTEVGQTRIMRSAIGSGQMSRSWMKKSSASVAVVVYSFGSANSLRRMWNLLRKIYHGQLVRMASRRYIPSPNVEGPVHCPANPVSADIFVTLGSSAACRLLKLPNWSASARSAFTYGRPIVVGHGMLTCLRSAKC
jgi:hypothetical protein